jgi:hypothetical protein
MDRVRGATAGHGEQIEGAYQNGHRGEVPCREFRAGAIVGSGHATPPSHADPRGHGVAVSDWRLARAVSVAGQLGVVSGTALESVMVRRPATRRSGGHTRRALGQYPVPAVADSILDGTTSRAASLPTRGSCRRRWGVPSSRGNLRDLLVASNFVEVHLAREGHSGPVGINYMEKIQTPLWRLSMDRCWQASTTARRRRDSQGPPCAIDRLAEGPAGGDSWTSGEHQAATTTCPASIRPQRCAAKARP